MRLIDRIRWDESAEQGELRAWALRVGLDEDEADSGSSAEVNPVTDTYDARLRCGCGIDVKLTLRNVDRLARILAARAASGESPPELVDIAARISKW